MQLPKYERFLPKESCKEKAIRAEIIGDTEQVKGRYGSEYHIPVKVEGIEYTLSLWRQHLREIETCLGQETTKWINQQIFIKAVPLTNDAGKNVLAWEITVAK